MTYTALEIMTKFFEAERAATTAVVPTEEQQMAILNLLSPDVVMEQPPDLPYGGVYRGRDGFMQFFGAFSGFFDSVDPQPKNVFESGDQVVVYADISVKARKNQKTRVVPMVQVVTVDREKGYITHVKVFPWDVSGINAFLEEPAEKEN